MTPPPRIALLAPEDVDRFVAHIARQLAASSHEGLPTAPFSADYRMVPLEARANRLEDWALELDEPGWQRSWGLFDGDEIVGHASLRGGMLASDRHRAGLGMGLEPAYRRQGHGTALLSACIAWARANELAWIDLGVFASNRPALALYEGMGFVRVGATVDRFRVDGRSIDDVQMTLRL